MRSSPSPLEEARAKHQEHLSDRDKFRKLLDNLQVGAHASPLIRCMHCSGITCMGRMRIREYPPVQSPLQFEA